MVIADFDAPLGAAQFSFKLWRQTVKTRADPRSVLLEIPVESIHNYTHLYVDLRVWVNITKLKWQLLNLSTSVFVCLFELESSKQMFPLCFIPFASLHCLLFLLFHIKSGSDIDFCDASVTCQSVRIKHTVTGTVAKQNHRTTTRRGNELKGGEKLLEWLYCHLAPGRLLTFLVLDVGKLNFYATEEDK